MAKKEAGKVKEGKLKIAEQYRKKDLLFWILIIALIALPIAGTMLHIKLHKELTWLSYITLFDAVIITLLYFSKKQFFMDLYLILLFL